MGDMWKNLMSNLKRERFLAITNVIVMSVTFLMLGIFVYIVAVSQTALKELENQAQVTVFFKDDFPEKSILEFRDALQADDRVSQVNYISKDDAFAIFTEIHKDEPTLLKAASPTILPASLEIKTRKLANLSLLAEELGQKDGVEEVKFYKDVIERFRSWGNIIYAVGFVLVVLFLLISYSVILVTLRLTISAKGTELEILKLVGASDAYVKSPLLFQGMFFGGFSSLIAALVLVLLSVVTRFSGLLAKGVSFGFIRFDVVVFSLILSVLLILSGILLGYFGSLIAVKKYLKY